MLQSSASNVNPPTNIPNMSTAGSSMNPQMNQMTSQMNMQVYFKTDYDYECERCDECNFLVI